ncbi:hypothetical protein T439DRAFT_325123 [Meredithblackwellia eburnea MCA 4105]
MNLLPSSCSNVTSLGGATIQHLPLPPILNLPPELLPEIFRYLIYNSGPINLINEEDRLDGRDGDWEGSHNLKAVSLTYRSFTFPAQTLLAQHVNFGYMDSLSWKKAPESVRFQLRNLMMSLDVPVDDFTELLGSKLASLQIRWSFSLVWEYLPFLCSEKLGALQHLSMHEFSPSYLTQSTPTPQFSLRRLELHFDPLAESYSSTTLSWLVGSSIKTLQSLKVRDPATFGAISFWTGFTGIVLPELEELDWTSSDPAEDQTQLVDILRDTLPSFPNLKRLRVSAPSKALWDLILNFPPFSSSLRELVLVVPPSLTAGECRWPDFVEAVEKGSLRTSLEKVVVHVKSLGPVEFGDLFDYVQDACEKRGWGFEGRRSVFDPVDVLNS